MKFSIYKKGWSSTSGCFLSDRAQPPKDYRLYAEIDCYRAVSAARSFGYEIDKESTRYSAQQATEKIVGSLLRSSTVFSVTVKG